MTARLLIALYFLMPATLVAQTARQGTAGATSEQFHSPMILETALPVADPAKWNNERFVGSDYLGVYVCDGVSLAIMNFRATPQAPDSLRVTVTNVLKNRPGHDKWVTVTYEALLDGKPIARPATLSKIDLEENRSLAREVQLSLSRASLSKGHEPSLRITVEVRDN